MAVPLVLLNNYETRLGIQHMQEAFTANVGDAYKDPTTVDEGMHMLYQATGENYLEISNVYWFQRGLVTNNSSWKIDVRRDDFSCRYGDLTVLPTVVYVDLILNSEIIHSISTNGAVWRIEDHNYKTEIFTPNFLVDVVVRANPYGCGNWFVIVSSTYIGP